MRAEMKLLAVDLEICALLLREFPPLPPDQCAQIVADVARDLRNLARAPECPESLSDNPI
jgi:hypothetical protein